MGAVDARDLEVRAATPDDDAAAVAMLRTALGKENDPHYADFLSWKHHENPFGQSPAWIAVHDGRIVGYRTFLRWRFLDDNGQAITAVRAVDTATDAGYRGLGIFRTLTLAGVAELTKAGAGIVFNTPNDQSRPGYLKMGWTAARRLPTGVLPSGPRSLPAMLAARTPANLWSDQTTVGIDAADALSDHRTATALLQHAPRTGFRTDRSPDYLAWRTSFGPLQYRLLLASPSDPAEGGIIFRLRRRGTAIEAAVVEQLVPRRRVGLRLVRRVLNQSGADYAIGLRTGPSAGLLPLPRQGPLLTTRPLAGSPPPASAWSLTLGDIELF